MFKRIFAVFFILLPVFSWGLTENKAASEYSLKNGLKLIVKVDKRSPVVVSEICYRVGSAYEPDGLTGISHVLEHMMFKGTTNHGPGEFSKIIAANGGNENAYTSYDFTCYFQELAKDRLAISLELEADRMQHLLVSPNEFAKEIQVVMEERRMRTEDNPMALTNERFQAEANTRFAYQHPVIGWKDDLEHLSANDVAAWYQQWYTPNNAAIIIVGDVEPRSVFNLVEKYFGNIPKKDLPLIKQHMSQPFYSERSIVVKAPAKLPLLMIGFNVPSLTSSSNQKEAYALEMLAMILAGGDSSRLPKVLVRDQQLASEIGVSYDLYSRLPGIFEVDAIPSSKQNIQQLKQAILKQIQLLQTKPVSLDELKRAKIQLIAKSVFSKDSMLNQAMQLGRFEVIGLSPQELSHYVEAIKAVTPQEIQTVAQKYLIPERQTTAILEPQVLSSKTRVPVPTVRANYVR